MKRLYGIILLLQLFNPAFTQERDYTVYLWSEVVQADPDTVYGVNLSKLKLNVVPSELEQFKNLKYLDLSKNKLKSLPDFLADFHSLETIDVSKNQLDIFPLVITRIPTLKSIIANRNTFDRLPESIGYLKMLENIDLWETPVVNFPESFFGLTNLKKVDLSGVRYSPTFQEKLKIRLPNVQLVLDAPCDCME